MKSILVVDDEFAVCKGISLLLKGNGYQVYEAFNGLSALQIVKEKQIELVILDLFLPDLDGVEVAERIKLQKPGLKILLLTAHGDNAKAKHAREIFGNNYLEKISLNEVLLNKVEEILK